MKKSIRVVIGMALFVAGYHHTHRHPQYIAAQSVPTNRTIYGATPPSGNLKTSVTLRFIKPS